MLVIQQPVKYQPSTLGLIHKKPFVLLLVVMQKPKAAWLLGAKTIAVFCLCCVHSISPDERLWMSFSSYQLQIGPTASKHFFFQHRNNLMIQVFFSVCDCTSDWNWCIFLLGCWEQICVFKSFACLAGTESILLRTQQSRMFSKARYSINTWRIWVKQKQTWYLFPVFLAMAAGNLSTSLVQSAHQALPLHFRKRIACIHVSIRVR